MQRIDCDQYSASWWSARRGIPTASEFGCVLTPKTAKPSAQQHDLICRLIADLYDPLYPREAPATDAMRNGSATEAEARRWYQVEAGCRVEPVGLCLTDCGRFGCSPDGLVGADGSLELKCPLPKTHVAYLLAGALPDEYRCQVHGQLIVTGRKWVDWMSYCPGFPPMLIRVEPDQFTKRLEEELEAFWGAYQAAKEKIGGQQ